MKAILYFFCLSYLLLKGCFLFPGGPVDPTTTPPTPFTPTLEWIKPTSGVAMDVNPKYIFSAGEQMSGGKSVYILQIFNSDGTLAFNESVEGALGVTRELVATDQPHYGVTTLDDYITTRSKNVSSSQSPGVRPNPYTRYNTVLGGPDTDPYPWAGYFDVVGPTMARGPEYITRFADISRSIWMVGTFTDSFQPYRDFPDVTFTNSCPTFGKADCFVILYNPGNIFYVPVRHQWGGPENDLAYDVASDRNGNPTIFLRAGSDFAITSATQSLVRMKTGYNVVRLDTNGLLTETFPVTLEAPSEITDTQIVLGKNGIVYILAKDEVKKQYFLAKVSRSGTAWTRYFPPSVSDKENSVPGKRTARMGLTVDSKDCPYITGSFFRTVDFGGVTLTSATVQVFTAKYSPDNKCLGALAMGTGCGVTIRLSPAEDAVYVNGWAFGEIMGTYIPNQNDDRNGVLRPGAFLVKLKL